MSAVRWLSTTVALSAVGWLLSALAPAPTELQAALADPQHLVDTAGPDALLLAGSAALAWLCWAWGALGLALTAASALPGWAGDVAGVLLRAALPAAARRAVALTVGLSVTAGGGAALAVPATPLTTASASAPAAPAVLADWPSTADSPDWPAGAAVPAPPAAAPDRPSASAGDRVVLRGDCLWDIARDWLAGRGQPAAPDAAVAAAVDRWWQANAEVIGPDPDLLLPGQVLRPPA